MIRSVIEAKDSDPGAEPDAPLRVLFVCTANICRSAYAEVAARHLAGAAANVTFSSAGTYGLPAQPLNRDIAEFLPPGATAEGFASRKVSRAMVHEADLVLTAEAAHRSFLLQEDPRAFRKVLTLGQFAEVVTRSGLRGRELVTEAGRRQPPVRSEHDLRDPYRRGRAANAKAAARIDELLAIVVPALVGGGTAPQA